MKRNLILGLLTFMGCIGVQAASENPLELLEMPRRPYAQQEDFETDDPVILWESEGSFRIRFKGLTNEDSAQGTQSFKLDLEFETDGHCIWRIPWGVPLEGPMEQSFQWRAGRHCNTELLGVGYRLAFTPTDTYYRRNSCTIQGKSLKGNASEWSTCVENFGTPGWLDDLITSETRAGPLSLKVAAHVTKYDLGASMDPLVWIKGKAGQRAVLYLDNLKISGEAPDPATYHEAVQRRFDTASASFHQQLREWKSRYDKAISGLQGLQDVPEHLESSRAALERAAIHRRAKLEGMIDDGFADWINLDPVMDTLWASEQSVESLRQYDGDQVSSELVHYGIRPISNTTILPSKMPTAGAIAAGLEISACRGEFEPASFAVHALNTLEDLSLEISDLEGPGTIPASTIDPFVLKVWYRSGLYSGDANGRWLLKELLLKDDALVRVATAEQNNYVRHTAKDGTEEYLLCSGPTSDHLAYLRPVDAETLQPVTLPANSSKSFWLTIHVPDDAKAGDYRGTIVLTWGAGNQRHEIPLRLTVFPFDLPQSPLTYSVYNRARVIDPNTTPGYDEDRMFLYPHSEEVPVDRYEREIRNQVEHGVLHPNSYDTIEMAPIALAARQRAGVATDRFFCLDLWRKGLAKDASLKNRYGGGVEGAMEKLKKRVREWQAVTKEFGYKEVYFMGVDEARGDILRAERPMFKVIHKLGSKVWAAQTHETTFGNIGDLMDVAVMAGISKPSETRKWHGAGKEVFQYGGPMTEWDHPEHFRRNCGLVLWKNGYDGMMHYAYRHGFDHVWNDFDGVRRDHSFVLPVKGGLIDTIAWEGFREGVDDTRYVAALQGEIKKARRSNLAKQAKEFLREIHLAAITDEVRAKIVDEILRLRTDGRN